MDKLKQARKLFKKLIRDEKSIFYAVDRITRMLLNKARKSLYKNLTFLTAADVFSPTTTAIFFLLRCISKEKFLGQIQIRFF